MKVPVSWLREYVPLEMPLAELAARLAISSCEVDRVVRRGVADEDGNLGLFRVGHVLEAGKHPNADRLQLCQVDVGEGEPRQIVCGAWNFGAGATVAVALPGAVLPDGRRLEKAKLRGEVSNGMILSERELELSQEHAGIMVLEEPVEPGTPLVDVLPLGEDVLEIETGFNRPDLLAVYGIAREVAALYDLELAPPPGVDPERVGDEVPAVRIDDTGGCPRYVARLLRDVRVGPSPPWLKARLTAAGMRPISNVVDVTNYVMLGLGNPLHAFDAARLRGEIVVRRARPGERLVTLDDQERALDPSDLLITDGSGPIALAGIMGGAATEVGEATTEVLLEAANFEPVGIMRSSERLHLRTEGSNRWEKGVDPHLAGQAAKLATQLIVELAGARWVGHADVHAGLPERPVVRLRPARTNALVGLEIPEAEQRATLERLQFEVADDWNVTVPTWRARDVTREVDLVEEVARFRLEQVPFTLPTRTAMFGRLSQEGRLRRLVEDALVGCGFSEAYTSSLVAAGDARLRLREPLSEDQAYLRTTLREGLVESALRNVNAGWPPPVRLFELARVYLPAGGPLPEERWRCGGIASGGFFAAKGAVETVLGALRLDLPFEPEGGGTARIGDGAVELLRDPRLEGEWGFFELDLESLFALVPERTLYTDVITYPALKQDMAFVVDARHPAGALVRAMREAAGPELREVRFLSDYRGEQIPPGKKSLAFALAFQSPERTLTDEDAEALRGRIVRALRDELGAELRA